MSIVVAIACGSRDWGHPTKRDHTADRDALWSALDAESPDVLIEGGQVSRPSAMSWNPSEWWGADFLARCWAEERGVDCLTAHALWKARGRKAGPLRNKFQLNVAKAIALRAGFVLEKRVDYRSLVCVAVPLGGPGTRDMLRIVRDANWRVRLVRGSRER